MTTSSSYIFEGDPNVINIVGDVIVGLIDIFFAIAMGYFARNIRRFAVGSGQGARAANFASDSPFDAVKHIATRNGSIVAWCTLATFVFAYLLQPVLDTQLMFDTAVVESGEGPVGIVAGNGTEAFQGYNYAKHDPRIWWISDGWIEEGYLFSSRTAATFNDFLQGDFPPAVSRAKRELEWSRFTSLPLSFGPQLATVPYDPFRMTASVHHEGLPILGVATEFKMIGCDPAIDVETEEILTYMDLSTVTRSITSNTCVNGFIDEELFLENPARAGATGALRTAIVPGCFSIDRQEPPGVTDACETLLPISFDNLEDAQFSDLLSNIGRVDIRSMKINNWTHSGLSAIAVKHLESVQDPGVLEFIAGPGDDLFFGVDFTSLSFSLDNKECREFVTEGLLAPGTPNAFPGLSGDLPDGSPAKVVLGSYMTNLMVFEDSWCAISMVVYCGFRIPNQPISPIICKGATDMGLAVVRGVPRDTDTEKQMWAAMTPAFQSPRDFFQPRSSVTDLRTIAGTLLVSNLGFEVLPYYESVPVARIGAGYIVVLVIAVSVPIAFAIAAWVIGRGYPAYPVPENAWEGYQLGLRDETDDKALLGRKAIDPFVDPPKGLFLGFKKSSEKGVQRYGMGKKLVVPENGSIIKLTNDEGQSSASEKGQVVVKGHSVVELADIVEEEA